MTSLNLSVDSSYAATLALPDARPPVACPREISGASVSEEIVERHLGLYVVPIRVAANAIHGYHGKVDGIGGARLLYERLAAGLKL